MSITKLIKCTIKPNKKEQFYRGQLAWSELNSCDGFEGQFGGWTNDEEAIVLGSWKSDEDIVRFMDSIHDSIFETSRQSETMSHCQVQYFENVINIPSLSSKVASMQGCILRIAQCEEVQDVDKFMLDQTRVWNPEMQKAEGMLGGFVARSLTQSNHFLVITRWASILHHENYRENIFPSLSRQIAPETYINKLSGYVVHEIDAWNVAPNKGFKATKNTGSFFSFINF
ncbi:DUF4937 domain-containing protein [Vibrio sp. OCN044]|uniref:DUF4937 domain-containing protein n=1 Tax=Vibrio tetraodonis subsp. pristinus TaxID=2695891 RepID=A0A6L8LY61_9VIBR|nr:DUF4937 domain-containing protein [Vibrio tetraodonis]MYM60036.1 DUF4937 domain-containing protein [Vibrio tetraodonis subsp. pristinus]